MPTTRPAYGAASWHSRPAPQPMSTTDPPAGTHSRSIASDTPYVVLRNGVSGTPQLVVELQQFVRAKLAEYKRPRWVEFVPELPKTATGKIQRFKLRKAD